MLFHVPKKLLDMKFSKLTVKLFIAAFLLFLSFSVKAQTTDWVEDPMKKPDIWKQLIKTPTDSKLWETYLGKSFKMLTAKENEKLNLWKQELMLRKLTENESVVGLKVKGDDTDGFFIDEKAFDEFEQKIEEMKKTAGGEAVVTVSEFAGIEAIIMAERDDIRDLKQNTVVNFAIIEDVYNDIFEEYGIKYVYYKEKYPKEDYDRNKWITEHDNQLKKMKTEQVNKLKSRFTVVANSDK